MLIVGWGKADKRIGCAGLIRCGNCNNVCLFNIVEVKKRVSLYFVPVAKWSAKWYLVCTTCEAALELDEEQKNEVLRTSVDIPPGDTIAAIWAVFDEAAEKVILANDSSLDGLDVALGESIKKSDCIVRSQYPNPYCDYVKYHFIEEMLRRLEPEKGKSSYLANMSRPE